MDRSGWEGVYKALRNKGFNVSIVQNPTISLADDVAVTKRVILAQTHPLILVLRRSGCDASGQRPESGGTRLHCRIRAGQRRVHAIADSEDPAAIEEIRARPFTSQSGRRLEAKGVHHLKVACRKRDQGRQSGRPGQVVDLIR